MNSASFWDKSVDQESINLVLKQIVEKFTVKFNTASTRLAMSWRVINTPSAP